MNRKAKLRKQQLMERMNLSKTYCDDTSIKICNNLLQLHEFRKSQKILFYMPIRNEVDLTYAIEQSWEEGKATLLPVIQRKAKKMTCVQFQDWSELAKGTYGILEPIHHHRMMDPKLIDVVIVPGVAFDLHGYRLGYGGGYYDRFFTHYPEPVRIGVAYPEQLVPTVYPELHDQPLHILVTSDRIEYIE